MKLLLDTHILVWAVSRPERLDSRARAMIADRRNAILFGAATVWEVAIKFALKKPDFEIAPGSLIEDARRAEFVELPVTSRAAARVADLPRHHGDPFDRLLIAQAIDEDARLLTADATLGLYGSNIIAFI